MQHASRHPENGRGRCTHLQDVVAAPPFFLLSSCTAAACRAITAIAAALAAACAACAACELDATVPPAPPTPHPLPPFPLAPPFLATGALPSRESARAFFEAGSSSDPSAEPGRFGCAHGGTRRGWQRKHGHNLVAHGKHARAGAQGKSDRAAHGQLQRKDHAARPHGQDRARSAMDAAKAAEGRHGQQTQSSRQCAHICGGWGGPRAGRDEIEKALDTRLLRVRGLRHRPLFASLRARNAPFAKHPFLVGARVGRSAGGWVAVRCPGLSPLTLLADCPQRQRELTSCDQPTTGHNAPQAQPQADWLAGTALPARPCTVCYRVRDESATA